MELRLREMGYREEWAHCVHALIEVTQFVVSSVPFLPWEGGCVQQQQLQLVIADMLIRIRA